MGKAKLIIGGRASGKTTRLLNLMKDKKGILICHSFAMADTMKRQWNHIEGFKNIKFISCNQAKVAEGYLVDAVGLDNWYMHENMWNSLDFAYMTHAKDVYVTVDDMFDIEILDNTHLKEKK